MKITERKYTVDNRIYTEIRIENDCGMTVALSDCGAGIRDVYVPDRDGMPQLVTLRPADETLMLRAAHGKTIGRTAGRIANAEFTIGERTAHLEKNNRGVDNLHGGSASFRYKKFEYSVREFDDCAEVEFTYFSPDGEGGYFGNVTLSVTYALYAHENKLVIRYRGTCDEKTLLNVTNHAYWNLSGNLRETVENHIMRINASRFGYVNERGVTVDETAVTPEFDFRTAHAIGEFIDSPEVQRVTCGYDHPFFLDGNDGTFAVSVYSPASGIEMRVSTDYPCVVIYTNNSPKDARLFGGGTDGKYMAVCTECQYHPDGIHRQPHACGVFSPEKPYENEIVFEFNTELRIKN